MRLTANRLRQAIDLLVSPGRTRLTDMVKPLKQLNAIVQGNLVLASDVGGHLEFIRDGAPLVGREA